MTVDIIFNAIGILFAPELHKVDESFVLPAIARGASGGLQTRCGWLFGGHTADSQTLGAETRNFLMATTQLVT